MNDAARATLRKCPWIAAALVLAVAVVLQALPWMRPSPPSAMPPLAQAIPVRPEGWTSREMPLGPTEFVSSEAEKILNYDRFINREYENGSTHFGLYVAYWAAGKMPVQLVASHTPDRCWTENGWKCMEMRFRQTGMFGRTELPPAEWRLFTPPVGGPPTYVIFWHLVGGRAYDFGERFNSVPDPVRWWRGALHQALQGSGEQYFIRLMSDQPLESLWADPGFREVVRSLDELTRPLPSRTAARL